MIEPGHQGKGVGAGASPRGADSGLWEHDASVGLSVDFQAKAERIDWDGIQDARGIGQNAWSSALRPPASKASRSRNAHAWHSPDARSQDPSSRVPSLSQSEQEAANLGRAWSEPLHRRNPPYSSVPSLSEMMPVTRGSRRPITTEMRADQSSRRKGTDSASKGSNLEADRDFREFTRNKTGRVRLSQKKLEALKFAYRDELLFR